MDKMRKYAQMVIKIGVNIQVGEKLLIWHPEGAEHFSSLAMEEA